MNHEDLKTREGIKKRLLDLAAEANSIKDNELAVAILSAYNQCPDNVAVHNGALYMNGKLLSISAATLADEMAAPIKHELDKRSREAQRRKGFL
ncbi:acyl--CoA ligase [Lactobacillus paracasei]|uniref:acyl--CoA ligase n=1 Tax=Lacticaseibacillus paracasei TaxID=1597 RepID=UPI00136F2DE4|nr:acyl--CoA ligase [Lacticaseibacillus paracasei]MXI83370.1 acyl--CoA ligase [Lacticaseibacillus paracasei]